MFAVPLSRIEVRKRQRTDFPATEASDLEDSIEHRGLIHAPVCWLDSKTETWVLTVGERRYRAIKSLYSKGKVIRYDGEEVPRGHLPITRLDNYLDEIARFEAELDENTKRLNLGWTDQVRALADLHQMRQSLNPQQTLKETGDEVIRRGLAGRIDHTKAGERKVSEAVTIAKHLHNPKIAQARNSTEALALIYKQEEEAVTAALVRRKLISNPETQHIIRHGDLLQVLPQLDPGKIDLIIADPPYGIEASGGGFRARTVHHHNYEDTPEIAKQVAQCILTEGFRITKPHANIFIFCDIDLFPWLKLASANMGWTPFRRPLIWQKSESEGLAPWGGQGPRITTEYIFYATKGQRGMHVSPIDVFDDKRVPRKERIHAAEKPVELFKKLINCTTLPGDLVLDPCCGSGSSGVAAKETKRQYLGIEKDADYFNTATANVHGRDLDGKAE